MVHLSIKEICQAVLLLEADLPDVPIQTVDCSVGEERKDRPFDPFRSAKGHNLKALVADLRPKFPPIRNRALGSIDGLLLV